jgi:ribosomal-protein-alanine N-acetyltransferase
MIANPAIVHPLIRRLTADDLDRVLEIELTAYPYPWTRGIFADCIRVGYDCWGLQAGSDLIAYCIQSNVAGENHLLNLCVAPAWQRQGLGNLLLDHAVRLACLQGCDNMFTAHTRAGRTPSSCDWISRKNPLTDRVRSAELRC